MLVALRENGERFSLGEKREKAALEKQRRAEVFYCPCCGKKVLMKLGNKKIWHFAHESGCGCPGEWESETAYHLAGKLEIYRFLLLNGITAQLEEYVRPTRQRADVMTVFGKNSVAIEFQCATVEENELKKRTGQYESIGITPVWILGGKRLKRVAANIVSLSAFDANFIRKSNDGWFLPYFCPDIHKFIILTSIFSVSERRFLTNITVFSHDEIHLSHLMEPRFQEHLSLFEWQKEMAKYKASLSVYPSVYKRQLFLELYQHNLNLHLLPPEIGLPLKTSIYLETPPLIWQAYFYIDFLHIFQHSGKVTRSSLYRAFLRRIDRGEVRCRPLPLVLEHHFSKAIDEYLDLLILTDSIEERDDIFYPQASFFEKVITGEWPAYAKHFFSKNEKIISNHLSKGFFLNESGKRSVK
ncbi:competence protein CoiA [Bacillus massilinigeriensis]|uniref:competence protein CoiA n=1 Tax=Bacillus mediterraneensis TaxID=1805474 RepID=UPI0008F96F60|nr:competence protein CoiA family protein [Bacillus mediterraneensis]